MRELLNHPVMGTFMGLAVTVPLWLVFWWVNRCDRRRWELREQLRDMEQGGRDDARSAAINVWSHHWLNDATHQESETIGTFDVHWDPPVLWEIETNGGFSAEDLMVELGRLELNALGRVKHGDVPPAREGAS